MDVVCRNTLLREDFIKIKHNLTLPEALTHIQENKLTVDRYPVTVYKSVIRDKQIKTIDLLSSLKTCNSFEVFEQKFKSVADGIHQVILNSKTFSCTEELSKFSCKFDIDVENNMSQLHGLQTFNEYFLNTINSVSSALHIKNDLIGVDRETHLKFSRSTLLNAEPISGINIPMWMILSPGSVEPFKNYNRDLAHLNILLQGKSRIYVFVPLPFVVYFIEKVCIFMQKSCKFELLHRPGCLVNPCLLVKWDIPIQFFIQEPGDLIFINRGVLFCAINDRWSLIESINFSFKTCIENLSQITCQCENENLNIIKDFLPKSKKILRYKSKKEIYKCKKKNCIGGMAIYDKKTFYAHCSKEHGLKPFSCLYKNCTKRFTRRHDAERHVEYYHKKTIKRKLSDECHMKRKAKVICDICDKCISRRNLRRHMIQIHKLQSYLLEHNIVKHLKQCHTTISQPLTAEVYNKLAYVSYEELKMEHSVTARQIVGIKQLACNKTELNQSRETEYNLLKENLLDQMNKLKEEQKKMEQDKIYDNFILKLELNKAKQSNNQLKIDQNKKILQIERLQEELQKQKNMKICKILHLQLDLEIAEKKLNEITIERDDIKILKVELERNLAAAKAKIEKIQSETMSNQLRFCESLSLISKSSNDNTVTSKPHKYYLRSHLYK